MGISDLEAFDVAGVSISMNLPASESIGDSPQQTTKDHGLHNPIIHVSIKTVMIVITVKLIFIFIKIILLLLLLKKNEKPEAQDTTNPNVSKR